VDITVRQASAADEATITAMVRKARLNPRNLQWQRFVVAEHDGRIVGIAQLRLHDDGAAELASLVVEPALRRQGIASRLIDALLVDTQAEVYTLIDQRFVNHFNRWKFTVIDPRSLPSSVLRVYRVGRVVTTVASVLRRQPIRIVPLKRSPEAVRGADGTAAST
jgi:N-acetylglutamate synthase-like GNAT family acetyltransferase